MEVGSTIARVDGVALNSVVDSDYPSAVILEVPIAPQAALNTRSQATVGRLIHDRDSVISVAHREKNGAADDEEKKAAWHAREGHFDNLVRNEEVLT